MLLPFIGLAQNTYVPDDNFEQALIDLGYDNVLDDSVLTSNINTITVLNVSSTNTPDTNGIADLTGIEGFISLKILICFNNQLTALDVSANTSLTQLRCYNNQLDSLDVSHNTSLIHLRCHDNQLTTLDVSANTAIISLICNNNLITYLNLTNNPLLTGVKCDSNQLTSLDLRNGNNGIIFPPYFSTIGNPNLSCIDVDFVAYSTPIWTNIDPQHYFSANCAAVNGCTDSTASNYNPLANTDDGSCYFTYTITTIGTSFSADTIICYVGDTINFVLGQSHNAVEVSQSTYLSNGITSNGGFNIGLGQTGQFIPTIAQTYYYICQPHVTSGMKGIIIANTPPVNGCTDSTALNYNPNAVIDDGSCTYPMTYVPDDNFEAYLEFNGMGDGIWNNDYVITQNITNVDTLSIASQYIADLTGIADFNALTYLNCNSNQLTALDVSTNTALTFLWCFDNQLTALDVSGVTALTYLNCSYNQLTTLDVSGAAALTELYCFDNQITTLDLSGSTALTILHCYSNQLTTLDVSGAAALTELYCYSNQLTNLDVSGAAALTDLNCSFNQLTTLDVSGITTLTGLNCYSNQLTTLDVSGITTLTGLNCSYNQLTTLDVSGAAALTELYCYDNQITTLDLSTNTSLIRLKCDDNQLTTLDLSANTALAILLCNANQLTSLDLRNGNNTNMLPTWPGQFFNAIGNPNLSCIDVDSVAYSTANWINIDPQHYFSTNCSFIPSSWNCINNACVDPLDGTGTYTDSTTCVTSCISTEIEELNANKKLIKITDVLGRNAKETVNTTLFYIYDDGSVEKKIILN